MMFRKKRCCCRNCLYGAGLYLIAVGAGLLMAYAIPRYMLIVALGIGLIALGFCWVIKK
ncbi:MAG: hypothetical protein IJ285_05455 [Clostridia bacterium]|nr:hypothetical protein [Clostridia bacterium]